ncbi:MAG: hypothetical protein HKN03_07760 [Acidimicrobiales bacterium]|nr:hypothetical protein [Acidimicrobiales bacterium]
MVTNHFLLLRTAMILGAVILLSACGSNGDPQVTGNETTTTSEPADVPVADNDEMPDTSGMCAEGEPECNDTVGGGDDPTDLPDGEDEPASSGMPVDGGLSIADALASDSSGILAVRGFLLGANDQLRLCEELVGGGEKYACGGASVILSGLDMNSVPGLVFLEGTTFTEDEITVFGMIDAGVLEVNDLVRG